MLVAVTFPRRLRDPRLVVGETASPRTLTVMIEGHGLRDYLALRYRTDAAMVGADC
jgi:hypothetical protein